MKVIHANAVYFDQWRVDFYTVQQSGSLLHKFSICDRETGSEYKCSDVYLTGTKAYLSAYFLCLRATLDKEQCPAVLIHLNTGRILSINLSAYELLAIDAVGAKLCDFLLDLGEYPQLNERLWCSGEFYQTMSLCNADGLLTNCAVEVRQAPYCSLWAIVYLRVSDG